jgi:hypothetical protein
VGLMTGVGHRREGRRLKTAGLGVIAVGAALAAAAGTSLVSASASTHWYNSTTTQNPTPLSGSPGTILSDSAIVTGHNPTLVVSFALFAPSDPQCTGTPVFPAAANKSAGNAVLSRGLGKDHPGARMATLTTGFTATTLGTYHWVAKYKGDSDNRPSGTGCTGAVTVSNNGGGGGGGVNSGTQGLSTGPGVPDTGVANSGVQGFYAFPGTTAEVGAAGLIGGALMVMAGPPLLVLARRSSRHLTRD